MALLWFDGFDMGDTLQRGYSNAGAITRYTTPTRLGVGAAVGTDSIDGLKKPFAASSQVFLGVALTARVLPVYPSTGTLPMISLFGDGGVTKHLTLAIFKDQVILYRGPRGGTVLATFARGATDQVYDYYEISATIDSSVGAVVVKINGTTVINFTGNTKNGGTNSTVDAVSFGNNWNGSGEYTLLDDLYVCDGTGSAPYNTFLGDVRVVSMNPTAAGSSTQWTPDSGSNYARVNEVPYSASSYVQSGTTGQRDTYAMSDLTGSPTVLATQTCVVAKKTDAGTLSLKPAVKSGASVYYGATMPLAVSDATITDLRTADPATSAAWTVSGVNALEAGMEVA